MKSCIFCRKTKRKKINLLTSDLKNWYFKNRKKQKTKPKIELDCHGDDVDCYVVVVVVLVIFGKKKSNDNKIINKKKKKQNTYPICYY